MDDIERARAAGQQYGEDQVLSPHFNNWVFDQLHEAMGIEVAPGLEIKTVAKNKASANESARRMLQQLWWDTKRGIETSEVTRYLRNAKAEDPDDRVAQRAFFEALEEYFRSSDTRSWLAEEVIMPFAKTLAKKARK